MGNMLTATWGGVFAKFHKVCQWQLVRIRLYSALAIQSGSYTISLSLCTTGSLINFCDLPNHPPTISYFRAAPPPTTFMLVKTWAIRSPPTQEDVSIALWDWTLVCFKIKVAMMTSYGSSWSTKELFNDVGSFPIFEKKCHTTFFATSRF